MKSLNELLTFELYPALYSRLDELLPEFELKPKSQYWQSSNNLKIDGSTGDAIGKVFIYANAPFGIKDYTRGFVTLWDYIQKRERLSNKAVLEYLAKVAQIDLPPIDGENDTQHDQQRAIATLWEEAFSFMRIELFESQSPTTQAVRNYLYVQRGYTPDEVRIMELGLLEGTNRLYQYLSQERKIDLLWAKQQLQLEKDQRIGKSHLLAIPFRSPEGKINGIAFRCIDEQIQPKYLNTSGSQKGLFNLKAIRPQNTDTIIVEGQLDALIATARGIPNVVALSGSAFSEQHIKQLKLAQVRAITFCLDNDEAGQQATEKAIRTYMRHALEDFRCYVAQLPAGEDPDSFLKKNTAEDFKHLLNQATRFYEYLAKRIIQPFTPFDEAKAIDAALDQLASIGAELPPSAQTYFIDYVDTLSPVIGIDRVSLKEQINTLKLNQKRKELSIEFDKILRKAIALNEKGDFNHAQQQIEGFLEKKSLETLQHTLEPYTPELFQQEILQTRDGLPTGIHDLDEIIRIPQGAITLIAGRTGHGKTTMMLNLFYSLCITNPKNAFYFFTYEEERKYIVVKLLNLIANFIFDDQSNRSFIIRYIRDQQNNIKVLEEAKKALYHYLKTHRMQVIDSNFPVEDLCIIVKHLKETSPLPIGAVFIDYIQKVSHKLVRPESRQQQIQHVSNMILQSIAKELSLPVIMGAQLNRDTDRSGDGRPKLYQLREAGDLEQDANLVLGIYNPAAKDDADILIDPKNISLPNDIIPFEVKALKNRDGKVNAAATLSYNPNTGRISSKIPEFMSYTFNS